MAENIVSQNTPKVKENSTISIEFIAENTPAVLSTDIAARFQKKHKHILDEIKRIQSITPKSFSELNFRPAEYMDEQGKPRPAYRLTRDGFSLLAMGFTGAAAIRWKLRYIEAFNALEAAVLENARQAALAEGVKAAFSLSAKNRALLNKIIAYKKRGLYTSEIAKLMDTHEIKVGMLTTQARRMGLLPENAGKHRGNPELGTHRAKAAQAGARATAAVFAARKEARP